MDQHNDASKVHAVEIDPVTGYATTGHEWDGIRELNAPLPRWWLGIFYATIVWSIGYWIVYPAWPMLTRVCVCACRAGPRSRQSADASMKARS